MVTAPTNGAAGIIPAVLRYFVEFVPCADSGAEVGCQGEVGSACSMAAAGLAQVMGGSPEQVENAAEIGMERNLGLTVGEVQGDRPRRTRGERRRVLTAPDWPGRSVQVAVMS